MRDTYLSEYFFLESLFLPGSSGSLIPRRNLKGSRPIPETSDSEAEEEEEEEEETPDDQGDEDYVEPVQARAAAKSYINRKIIGTKQKSKGKKRKTTSTTSSSDEEYETPPEEIEDEDETLDSAEEAEKKSALYELMQDDGREATYQVIRFIIHAAPVSQEISIEYNVEN